MEQRSCFRPRITCTNSHKEFFSICITKARSIKSRQKCYKLNECRVGTLELSSDCSYSQTRLEGSHLRLQSSLFSILTGECSVLSFFFFSIHVNFEYFSSPILRGAVSLGVLVGYLFKYLVIG